MGRTAHTAAAVRPDLPTRRPPSGASLNVPAPTVGMRDSTEEEIMSAPFIFIGTHTVKPGQLEAFKEYFVDFCDTVVEPNEPRLLSFQAYGDPESNKVTLVQIHPDAESMVNHMSLIAQHVTTAYADYLERESRWQIYGTPRAGVLEKVQAMAGDRTTPRSHEPFAGFTRW